MAKLAQFVGIDGMPASGKTTFFDALHLALESRGVKVVGAKGDKWLSRAADNYINELEDMFDCSSHDYPTVEDFLNNKFFTSKNPSKRLGFMGIVRNQFDKDMFFLREALAQGYCPNEILDLMVGEKSKPDIILRELITLNLSESWQESFNIVMLIDEEIRRRRSKARCSVRDLIPGQEEMWFGLYNPIINENIKCDEFVRNDEDDKDGVIMEQKAIYIADKIIERL